MHRMPSKAVCDRRKWQQVNSEDKAQAKKRRRELFMIAQKALEHAQVKACRWVGGRRTTKYRSWKPPESSHHEHYDKEAGIMTACILF